MLPFNMFPARNFMPFDSFTERISDFHKDWHTNSTSANQSS